MSAHRSRRAHPLFVTGTNTGVGKTWVMAALAAAYQARWPAQKVAVWKPVETGVLAERTAEGRLSDREWLARASGCPEVSGQWHLAYHAPLAPWVAAQREGRTVPLAELHAYGERLAQQYDRLFVEGAGGLLVPLTAQKTWADWLQALGWPLLIVADAGLGTVNHTLLTLEACRARQLPVVGVMLNGCRPGMEQAVEENKQMIERFGHTRVWAVLRHEASPAADSAERGAVERWLKWRQQKIAELQPVLDELILWEQEKCTHGDDNRAFR